MKLISLNIWGGRVFDGLISFIKNEAPSTDIFCFQEIYSTKTDTKDTHGARANIYEEFIVLLPDYTSYFVSGENNHDKEDPTGFELQFGLATFIKKNIDVVEYRDVFIHKYLGAAKSETGFSSPRPMQIINLAAGAKRLTVFNLHGLHNGLDKGDCDERIEQFTKVKTLLGETKTPKIVCGDFNALPDTESLRILETDMENLIKKYDVQSTRSSLYKKDEKMADYTLVSKDVIVKSFEVPDIEVSDHLPMVLEFDI